MVLSRLTKITGPGIRTDTNWVGNNANYTGILTASSLGGIGNLNATGIITATKFVGPVEGNVTAVDGTFSGNVSIAGTLTYENVTNVDSVGVITARSGLVSPNADIDDFVSVGSNIHLGNAGVITATSFSGSGANLTGIDATSIKDSGGNVKIQAQASGAVYTGIHTFNSDLDVDGHTNLDNLSVAGVGTIGGNLHVGGVLTYEDVTSIDSVGIITARSGIKVGTGVTIEPNGQATFIGIVTFGSGSTTIDNNVVNVGTALTLGHTQGLQFHTQNLHSQGFEVNQINSSGIITATTFKGNGDFVELDVDGHTNLDNVSIAGVTTMTGVTNLSSELRANGNIRMTNAGPKISFIDSNHDSDFHIENADGSFEIRDVTNGADRVRIASNGTISLLSNVNVSGDLDVDGHTNLDNVSISGVVTATSYHGDGSNLTGLASREFYGFVGVGNSLSLTTTNSGADNIDGATYAAFEESFIGPSGISFSINTSGNLIMTV